MSYVEDRIAEIKKYGAAPESTAWLYVIACDRFFKVGRSANLENRVDAMRLMNPMDVSVAFKKRYVRSQIGYIERDTHAALREWHHRGEWFTAPLDVIRAAIKTAETEIPKRERAWRQLAENATARARYSAQKKAIKEASTGNSRNQEALA